MLTKNEVTITRNEGINGANEFTITRGTRVSKGQTNLQ